MNNYQNRIERLVTVIKELLPKSKPMLEQRRREGEELLERDDFVWQVLLNSMSTWGKDRYDALMNNLVIYETITYDAMTQVSDDKRHDILLAAFKDAGLRYHVGKAEYMTKNFIKIREMGGAKAAKERYLSLQRRDEKFAFWDDFAGIGSKYARNIPMDICDEHFVGSVALDDRLQGIGRTLGFADNEVRNYAIMEPFYLEVAKQCGLTGWEIDRILFNFKSDVIRALEN